MSRGLGRVQRGVLAAVCDGPQDRWWTLAELVAVVGPERPGRAGMESVRRAVKTLAGSQLVEVEHFDELVDVQPARINVGDRYAYRPAHYSTRLHLFVHEPLSVEQKTAREQTRAALLERLVAIDARIPT